MLNATIVIKLKQRLNKLDSQDYDNIQCWQIAEAFNKAQVEWVRRQLHGVNLTKEGDEGSTRRKDDLQILLTDFTLSLNNKKTYYSGVLPVNYLQWKRVDIIGSKDCCGKKPFMVYLAEEGNLRELLRDKAKQPNYEWAETFATLKGGNVNVYTNEEFTIDSGSLIYYREPRKIEILGCIDPYTNTAVTTDVQSELKDDIVELIIDEAAAILAGDIESINQFSRGTQGAERNN